MSGLIDLLSSEERAFLQAASKQLPGSTGPDGLPVAMYYEQPRPSLPQVDYTGRSTASLVGDILDSVSSQLKALAGLR